MKTGEGKSVVIILNVFITVCMLLHNDYLAKRDAEYVFQVHQFLGLSVGLI